MRFTFKKTKTSTKPHLSCAYCAALHLCLPEDLSTAEQDAFDGIVEGEFTLLKGSTVCDSTQPMRYLYAVRTGSFKEYAIDREGREQIIDFYFPGDIIGLDTLGRRSYYYTTLAIEKSPTCRISFVKLQALMEQHPGLQRRLLQLVSQQSLNRTFLNHPQFAEQKLAIFLISLSQRFSERRLSATDDGNGKPHLYPVQTARPHFGTQKSHHPQPALGAGTTGRLIVCS